MYITLEEYLEYGGEKVTDESLFERLEARAWHKLNNRTMGRIKEPLDNIKRLMVELIDLEKRKDERVVQSVSNDGVSVSYSDRFNYTAEFEELVSAYAGALAWRGVG